MCNPIILLSKKAEKVVEKKNPQIFPCGSIKYNLTGLKRNATNVYKTLVNFLLGEYLN